MMLPQSVSIEIASKGDAENTEASPTREELGQRNSAQNIDSDTGGGGGESTGAVHTLRMYPHDDDMTLQDSLMNTFLLRQTQRINTALERASLDDRRATPHPATERTVTSTEGRNSPSRPTSQRNPQSGKIDPAATLGATPQPSKGPIQNESAADATRVAQPVMPSQGTQPLGVRDGAGQLASPRVHSRPARPNVHEGPAATPRLTTDARVRDRENAELLAAQLSPSWIQSTRRQAAVEGPEQGGVGNHGDPGSGANNTEGGRALPYNQGNGSNVSFDSNDPRYVRWFLEQRGRVSKALRYPRQRQLAMDQGTSVYRLEVRRNGSLAEAPRLIRSSGFGDLDEAAQRAIENSVPFSPLPPDLAPEQALLRITMAIEFSNPMVH